MRTQNIHTWEKNVEEGIDGKEYLSVWKYLRRLTKLNPSLLFNAFLYASVLFLLFLLNYLSNRFLYLTSSVEENISVLCKVLVGVTITSLLYQSIRPFTYYLSNRLLREPIWHNSVQDLLMSMYYFHPLWLTSSSLSAYTLQHTIIEKGLGSFAAVLNRFSYVGPMFMTLFSSIWVLVSVHAYIAVVFLSAVMLLNLMIILPYKEVLKKERDNIVKTTRSRFSTIERLEFQRLSTMSIRGPSDYSALVDRLLAYRQFYSQSTYANDFKTACLSLFTTCSMEILSFIILYYYIIHIPNQQQEGNSSHAIKIENSCNTTSGSAGNSSSSLIIVIALINALRAMSDNIAGVIEHSKYLNKELSDFQQVSGHLEQATTLQQLDRSMLPLPGLDSDPKVLQDKMKSIENVNTRPHGKLLRFSITIHPSIITVNHDQKCHQVIVHREIELHGGDVVVLQGPNGSGKSLFLNGMAGRYEPHLKNIEQFKTMHKFGLGSTSFETSVLWNSVVPNEKYQYLEKSGWNLYAMSRSGLIAEYNQQVEGINLGTRDAVTLGDVMLRMNNMLKNCTESNGYCNSLHVQDGDSISYIHRAFVEVIDACGLTNRFSVTTDFHGPKDHLESMCSIPMHGLSGGEQQRLRLASLFFLEKLRYAAYMEKIASEVLGSAGRIPMQILLLDEPDQFIDQDFLKVFSQLMQSLEDSHRNTLITVMIIHKEITSIFANCSEHESCALLKSHLRLLKISSPATMEQDMRDKLSEKFAIPFDSTKKNTSYSIIEESTI